jgi:hypothetical protein
MRTWIQVLCFAVFIIFLGSCNDATEALGKMVDKQFEKPPHKTIKIKDVDNTWPAKISDINGQDVLLALTSSEPDPTQFTAAYVESLMRSVFALGPVKDNTINLKLYSGTLDYWTGSGDYWILFVLPNKSLSKITSVYLSNGSYRIYSENTLLYNTDFMPPYQLNLDLSGVLPF